MLHNFVLFDMLGLKFDVRKYVNYYYTHFMIKYILRYHTYLGFRWPHKIFQTSNTFHGIYLCTMALLCYGAEPVNIKCILPVQWRHDERDGVSNHRRLDCLLSVCSATDERKNKTPRHWPLCGEFTGDRWIPLTKGQLRVKCFHLMTSLWKDCVWVGPCCLKTGNKSEHNKTVSIFIGYTVLDVMFYLWHCQWGPNKFVSIPESDTLFMKYVTPQQFVLPFGRTDTLFTTHILLIIHQIFSRRCLQMLGKIEVKFTELCTPCSGINCPWLCFIAQIK